MPEPDYFCRQTTVRNATGGTRVFGFLPPHGKRLENGEEYSFFGSLDSLLAGITKKRQRDSLLAALADGSLQILKTPSPVYLDEAVNEGRTLVVSNGVVTSSDECWQSSAGA